ncbi:hypothetical protein M408DRAFT_330313 [Serendipita vermifera MAFF 305830]|uniref:AP-3 complex subunit delta n=1 Tax=Serendipita vermifera MAFF 305830 TaxID=933852 RepID=A0A0C2WKV2_SERVB|nr:hypothetical protein M408DRAFT_330313 [Serendipita vermifera MAFF 305830]
MWERTLQDLIRGLRANKNDERKFISQAIDEIRKEVRNKDMETKAGAILKMTFLDMLGYDLAWANFHIIEVMSSQKYHLKTVGYLASSQSFNQQTDVLMLVTNLLKKDLSSTPADVALALNGLSHFVSPDLARDLTQELNSMLNHSRAQIRKRVILALFKVIQQHPEALPYCLPRLKDKLEDPDPSVVSATVNLFCELARRNPKDFLVLAPPLFHILTTSSNNWMLIKVIKLFGAISPYEPRLVKKLQAPITELIQTTPAISLLYECVHTCIIGDMLDGFDGLPLARLCVNKLSTFLGDTDQNLKYIALMAMVKIVPIRPELVAEHQAVILESLNDFDISIRMRALELISSMITPNNAQFLVQQLLSHLVTEQKPSLPSAASSLSRALHSSSTPEEPGTAAPELTTPYRLEVASRIIDMCSQNLFQNVQDFDWYLSVLVDLIYVAGADVAALIKEQLVDVTVRVRACRNYAVTLMTKLLDDDTLVLGADEPSKCSGVLWAAAWICGEYSEELQDPHYVLMRLTQPSIALLPAEIISIYLQATIKVFSCWAVGLTERWGDELLPRVKESVNLVLDNLRTFASHGDVEVQERAANAIQLLTLVKGDLDLFRPAPPQPIAVPEFANQFDDIPSSMSSNPVFPKSLLLIKKLVTVYNLRPVAPSAQKQVAIPNGLNLDKWIVPPPKSMAYDDFEGDDKKKKKKKGKGKARAENGALGYGKNLLSEDSHPQTEEDEAELSARRAQRLARQQDDPYYLTDKRLKPASRSSAHDIDSIPIVRLDDMPSLSSHSTPPRVPSRMADIKPPSSPKVFEVDREGEAPAEGSVGPPSDTVHTPAETIEPGIQAPEAIVVKRVKKKTGGKKKNTVPL